MSACGTKPTCAIVAIESASDPKRTSRLPRETELGLAPFSFVLASAHVYDAAPQTLPLIIPTRRVFVFLALSKATVQQQQHLPTQICTGLREHGLHGVSASRP
jgi:hypothetical protein